MPASSLLALIDDITSILDDVALLTKVAAKQTSGVVGDDLALNAEQASGVSADRELPVVWAVAKGSLLNKAILVPAALLISAFVPKAILPLLMIGGLYLCYEGVEKIAHKLLHSPDEDSKHHAELVAAVANPQADVVAVERDKIKGAIRTDFILSAEIIVIALGTMATASMGKQVLALSFVAVAITVLVYGLVAGIVKLDDLGLRLHRREGEGGGAALQRRLGAGILLGAPVPDAQPLCAGHGRDVHGGWQHHRTRHPGARASHHRAGSQRGHCRRLADDSRDAAGRSRRGHRGRGRAAGGGGPRQAAHPTRLGRARVGARLRKRGRDRI